MVYVIFIQMIGQNGVTQFWTLLFHSRLHFQNLVGFDGMLQMYPLKITNPPEGWVGCSQWQLIVSKIAQIRLYVAHIENGIAFVELVVWASSLTCCRKS